MGFDVQKAHTALAGVFEPVTGKSLTELKLVDSLDVEGDVARVHLSMHGYGYPSMADLRAKVSSALTTAGASKVDITDGVVINTRDIQADDPCPNIKNIILVMSGKGGVGKSTVATNLAIALKRAGAAVGLLDADMYGPSIPTMLGVMGRPVSEDGKTMQPLSRFDLKLMSLGFLLEDAKQAVVWRGPMLQSALLQFLREVDWGPLDYLILDLPPGTGDITLTISQKMRTTGAVVVTTPQEVALQDVYKSVSMAHKVGIHLLGVVENESYFVCDGCDKRHTLFGEGGGAAVAEFSNAPLLAQLPLHPAVREWGDAGTPIAEAAPESEIGAAFALLAARLACHAGAVNAARGGGLKIDRTGGKSKFLPVMR